MKTFFSLEVIPKKVFIIFVGENSLAKLYKNVSEKILRTHKFLPAPTHMAGAVVGQGGKS